MDVYAGSVNISTSTYENLIDILIYIGCLFLAYSSIVAQISEKVNRSMVYLRLEQKAGIISQKNTLRENSQ